MIAYTHPQSIDRSAIFLLSVNEQPVEVLSTGVADFAIAALEESDLPARIEVQTLRDDCVAKDARVLPSSHGIACEGQDHVVRFELSRPGKISLECGGGLKPLYLFLSEPEREIPKAEDPNVVTFPTGEISEQDILELEDDQTLYLPGGAVLRGAIRARNRRNIRICGHGIVDGSFYDREKGDHVPGIVLEGCAGVTVEDITMIRPSGWMLVPARCEDVHVQNIRQIGEVVSSDGIDVVGCRRVLIENCFLHNNDDCVVIKAFDIGDKNLPGAGMILGKADAEDITVERCVLANWTAGNAMEIGHELSADHVRNIVFRDIDVLHVHGQGAVFSLHNYGRATIEDVLFENIRIEHCYDKFIDFRISRSRFSVDNESGHIRGVTLRSIAWHQTPYNAGYTISLIGGRDEDHQIEDVLLEDIRLGGHTIQNLEELEIHLRHTNNIRLISPSSPSR
jgi:hypothetical protein